MARRAVVAGATGLVGSALLSRLLESPDYERVLAVGRREPEAASPKLAARVVNFERLAGVDLSADDAFCCLGTTRRDAGSAAAFQHVDYDLALAFIRAARAQGARRLFLVSSVGANPRSPFLYPRVKGELEEAVKTAGFEAVHVFRPSLLLGARTRPRAAERVLGALLRTLAPLMIGPLSPQAPIAAETVAAGILAATKSERAGVFVHAPDDIRRLAS